jgi:hypothetical protein
MRKSMSERQIIAHDIAHDLNQVENAIDAAIAAAGGLVGRLPAYRTEAALSAVSGQEVFAALSQATALLATARGEVVRGHHKLEVLRRAMKLEPVTAGPTDVNKPSTAAFEATIGMDLA